MSHAMSYWPARKDALDLVEGRKDLWVNRPIYPGRIAFILLVCDIFSFLLLFILSSLLVTHELSVSFSLQMGSAFMTTFLIFYILDLYNLDTRVFGLWAPARTILAVAVAGIVLVSLLYFLPVTQKPGMAQEMAAVLSLFLFAVFAVSVRFYLGKWARVRTENMRWLVLSDADCIDSFQKDCQKNKIGESLFCLINDADFNSKDPSHAGTWTDIDKHLAGKWSGIVLATRVNLPNALIEKLMRVRFSHGIQIFDLNDFYERFWLKLPVFHLKTGWFAMSHGFDLIHNPVGLRMKRILDLAFAFIFLVVSIPLLMVIVVAVFLESGGPIFYKQLRTGENGKNFTLYKFRSMQVDAEKNGAQWATANDPRVTRVGKWLRLMRLDELPQLYNVLKGEMSFIGPRPERPEFNSQLEEIIPYYDLRHLIRPGITGWAQVLYPYGASIEDAREKFQYDLYYIKNYSFFIDVAIILKTIRIMIFGKGR